MVGEKENNSVYDYSVRAQECAPDDFWGQVRRTINGKAVPQEQIDLIVNAMNDGLNLQADDILLDIGCGNGALTQYFYNKCAGSLGVDRSSFLIDVANKNFSATDKNEFVCSDAVEYLVNEQHPERFTKVICYGTFSFFSERDAEKLLSIISKRFINVETFIIGNVRDLKHADKFFVNKEREFDVKDHTSTMGIWRTQDEMVKLVNKSSWSVTFKKMPEAFYAREYYFDAVLSVQKE